MIYPRFHRGDAVAGHPSGGGHAGLREWRHFHRGRDQAGGKADQSPGLPDRSGAHHAHGETRHRYTRVALAERAVVLSHIAKIICCRPVALPHSFPYHEVATQICSTKMKMVAHFLSCLVNKTLSYLPINVSHSVPNERFI